MAVGDIIGAAINADGWTMDITIQGLAIGGSYDYALGADNDPSTAKVVVNLTSKGYNASGVLGTIARTVYGVPDINTGAVRKASPNQTSPDETTSGSDVVIRVALSEFIYSSDVSVTVTVASAWYTQGGTPNNAITSYSVTNNSNEAYPVVCGHWGTANAQVVTGNFDVEFVAFHKFGAGGKPLAAVKITATDQNTNSVTETLTDMVLSSSTGDQNSVLVYKSTINVSTLVDGDKITIKAEAYPWVGDANSIMDTNDLVNTFPHGSYTNLVFRLDKAVDHGWTVVDTGGNDGTGTVYGSQAAAEAGSAFLTIAAALTAVQSYNNTNAGHNDAGGGTILLGEGTWTINTTNGGTLSEWVIIKPKTGALKVNTIFNPAAANSAFPTFMKVQGVTINTANYYRAFGTDCLWIDDCTVTFSGILSIYQTPYSVFTNNSGTLGTGELKSFSTTTTVWGLVRGNNMNDLVIGHLYSCLGNFNIGSVGRTNVNESLNERGIFAYNVCQPLKTNLQLILAVDSVESYASGFAVVQNLFVRYGSQAQAMMLISSDGTVTTTKNIILWYNTFAGARSNLGYNDIASGGPYAQNDWSMKGNIFSNYNNKDDTFNGNASATGSWPVGYNVGSEGNQFRSTATDEWLGEFQGLWMKKGSNATPLSPDFVTDNSADGADTSGGDYHLNPTAPTIGLWDDYLLPYDIEGNPRNSAVGDVGAYATITTASGKISRYHNLNGLGGQGQQSFNPLN